jgi:hypothetical protein
MRSVSDLRHPNLDPEHVLEPERLVEYERSAEPTRLAVAQIPAEHMATVRTWIAAELEVERKRAQAVDDFELAECLKIVEQRLSRPGDLLREAEAAAKVRDLLVSCGAGREGRAPLRVLRGGRR